MDKMVVKPAQKMEGIVEVPGDKSISHRSVMVGAIAEGVSEIRNYLVAEDTICTINAFREMGVDIKQVLDPASRIPKVIVEGKGLQGLKKPPKELYLGNSGTTMRIISGIMAGQDFECVLCGDESLSRRPMKRIVEPLRLMGAEIGPKDEGEAKDKEDIYPPIRIQGRCPLRAIQYKSPVASAQVKSAILLAGLYADGVTEVEEPVPSRDHTERMLKKYGGILSSDGCKVSVNKSTLRPRGEIFIPGDISSASFFMVAAAILKSSKVTLKNVGVNPTRSGVIDILKRMGAKIELAQTRGDDFEPMADITVRSSDLKGVTIEGEIIPRAIDELPVIMVAAAVATGVTTIKGAGELRVKETDRINSMETALRSMGADIAVQQDTVTIRGKKTLKGAEIYSFKDHRTAMSVAMAGLRAEGETAILDIDCIKTSFPAFEEILRKLV